MNDKIVITQTDRTERDECGQVTRGVAVEATRAGICIEFAHSDEDEGKMAVDWEAVLKHVPKSAMLKELWSRLHKDGSPPRQKKGYRCIPKGCPTCGGDLFQMHFPFGQKTLTCLECDGKITYEREADLKSLPPSMWI